MGRDFKRLITLCINKKSNAFSKAIIRKLQVGFLKDKKNYHGAKICFCSQEHKVNDYSHVWNIKNNIKSCKEMYDCNNCLIDWHFPL